MLTPLGDGVACLGGVAGAERVGDAVADMADSLSWSGTRRLADDALRVIAETGEGASGGRIDCVSIVRGNVGGTGVPTDPPVALINGDADGSTG